MLTVFLPWRASWPPPPRCWLDTPLCAAAATLSCASAAALDARAVSPLARAPGHLLAPPSGPSCTPACPHSATNLAPFWHQSGTNLAGPISGQSKPVQARHCAQDTRQDTRLFQATWPPKPQDTRVPCRGRDRGRPRRTRAPAKGGARRTGHQGCQTGRAAPRAKSIAWRTAVTRPVAMAKDQKIRAQSRTSQTRGRASHSPAGERPVAVADDHGTRARTRTSQAGGRAYNRSVGERPVTMAKPKKKGAAADVANERTRRLPSRRRATCRHGSGSENTGVDADFRRRRRRRRPPPPPPGALPRRIVGSPYDDDDEGDN